VIAVIHHQNLSKNVDNTVVYCNSTLVIVTTALTTCSFCHSECAPPLHIIIFISNFLQCQSSTPLATALFVACHPSHRHHPSCCPRPCPIPCHRHPSCHPCPCPLCRHYNLLTAFVLDLFAVIAIAIMRSSLLSLLPLSSLLLPSPSLLPLPSLLLLSPLPF
jgi:hypothetical protein